jgi:glycosyltransferase involved in cell wall biosynthesis
VRAEPRPHGTPSFAGVRRIVFWQPIDSPHQESFLEAVGRRFQGEVILAVEKSLPPERVTQGWPRPRHERVRVVDISEPARHAALAANDTSESLHVFSGFFSHPLVWSGFRRLADSSARLAIFSEAPEQPPLTGWIKRLRGRLRARRWAPRFAFVLAIGGVGREFFRGIGWPAARIIPFGYFLDPPAAGAARTDGPFRLVSAGQLIRRKGIDLLVRACAVLPRSGWRLDIYGDGPERTRLERLAAALCIGDRVAFHGNVPHATVVESLGACDCAVLPSRFDGWGMLVSESLAVGTPAICTDRCGAAAVAEAADWNGGDLPRPLVVVRPAARALAAAIEAAVVSGRPSAARRAMIRAGMAPLAADAAAARFLEVVALL